ncbi:Fe2+-dependent dioxygenase [Leptolyngbya sp. AN02str]|uniref:Fe2+-dependent dioxygenase n=1 Tax=Leptolyngbya sp. AN02str TaxID=3423363 RepID=UPI003D31F317
MILCIGNVLTAEELSYLCNALAAASFVDGKTTAGWHARQVKHNTQLKEDAAIAPELKQMILNAIQNNSVFQMAVRPKLVRSPLISRYTPGMSYGTHVDNALMGNLRTDVSLTLFLNDPNTYEGGELVIEDSLGSHPFKLEAGSMVVYPSTTLHHVEPVTTGERLVTVTWVQSYVRDAGDREILFDLDTVRHTLFETHGKTSEFDLLSKTHANLLRKWAET